MNFNLKNWYLFGLINLVRIVTLMTRYYSFIPIHILVSMNSAKYDES